jgi:ssDNA-binding replication factor A large subunit
MKINELRTNSKVINLIVEIGYLDNPSETPTGVPFQEGIVSDDTGQVKITFWSDQVDKFKIGDKIMMTTGYCKEFPEGSGDKKISSGKFGKIVTVPKERPDEN